jgi:hypothetical protein
MKIEFKKLCLLLLITSAITYAQSGGDFTIKKSSIDAGGGNSSEGDFTINGTIGQVDASSVISGGTFSLTGGFWTQEPVFREDMMFKNGFKGLL